MSVRRAGVSIVGIFAAAGCAPNSQPMSGAMTAASTTAAPERWFRVRGLAQDPRVADYSRWVHGLESRSGPLCSAAQVTNHAVLTAAHCVDGAGIPTLTGGGAFSDRVCGHGPCDLPFPERDLARVADDIAVLWSPTELADVAPLRIAHVEGVIEGAVMVTPSAAWAVCHSTLGAGVGWATGTVDLGDSGSPIMGVTDAGPVVLGVVSHREADGEGWYFAVTPPVLPWPSFAIDDRPEVMTGDPGLSVVTDCQ